MAAEASDDDRALGPSHPHGTQALAADDNSHTDEAAVHMADSAPVDHNDGYNAALEEILAWAATQHSLLRAAMPPHTAAAAVVAAADN
mmetsp:Transcript_5726/g.11212  ORF Transcript_5726/g.11212 Transcript_5726/m.11212 type:complete len:88 (+) Transcript_5726:804-1067(+)